MSDKATAEKTITVIRPRRATDWGALLKGAADQHWRKLLLTIQIREKLHAGKPKQLDAAKAMLKARGLEDAIEAVDVTDPNALEAAASEVVDEGVCEFHRREGKPGLWWPSNNFKACIKENWSVLGYRMDARPASAKAKASKKAAEKGDAQAAEGETAGKALRGSRGALAEGLFVFSADPTDRDYIYLGEKPDGIDQNVSHTIGPKGPQSSIKRNEYLIRPVLKFEIHIARADSVLGKIPDESFADMLVHAAEHGIGANRSQGMGKFDIIELVDLD